MNKQMSMFGRLLICLACIVACTSSASSDLTVVGDDQHLWILLPAQESESGWDLLHAGSRSSTDEYRVVRHFDVQPLAMAALDRTLWIIFRGTSNQRLDVYRLQADYQPSVELYMMEPREGLGTLPPVPGIEQLLRCVATEDGPVMVGRASAQGADTDPPVAMQLRQGRWESISLPPSIIAAAEVLGTQTDRGLMLAQSGGKGLSTWLRNAEGAWSHNLVEVDAPMELLDVDGQPLLVRLDEAGMIDLAYLNEGDLWTLASLPQPDVPWGVVGRRGRASLISQQDRELTIVGVDAMTGRISESELLQPVSMLGTGLWSIAIAVGLASAVVLVIVLARGGDLSSMVVPSGWMVLPPLPRLWALCIDLLPGFLVFFFVVGGDWRHLIRVPLMSLNSLDFGSYLVLVGTTVLWCGVFECLVGSTPGKMLVGASVRATDGAKPRFAAICIRNVMKGFVLLVPPLAVLTLLHPNQQGVGDLMARTIVVRKRSSIELDQT